MPPKRAGILIFPNVEVLDFCGPFEVFSVARADGAPAFEVLTVAASAEPIEATGGLRVIPDATFDNCPPLDILVVPGGKGARLAGEDIVEWIKARGPQSETLASVCTGAYLLARAGLLDGRRATTHWAWIDGLREGFPDVAVLDHLHVVEDGEIITSAGISAGIDMALLVVARYHGEAVARAAARQMEYPYPDDLSRRV